MASTWAKIALFIGWLGVLVQGRYIQGEEDPVRRLSTYLLALKAGVASTAPHFRNQFRTDSGFQMSIEQPKTVSRRFALQGVLATGSLFSPQDAMANTEEKVAARRTAIELAKEREEKRLADIAVMQEKQRAAVRASQEKKAASEVALAQKKLATAKVIQEKRLVAEESRAKQKELASQRLAKSKAEKEAAAEAARTKQKDSVSERLAKANMEKEAAPGATKAKTVALVGKEGVTPTKVNGGPGVNVANGKKAATDAAQKNQKIEAVESQARKAKAVGREKLYQDLGLTQRDLVDIGLRKPTRATPERVKPTKPAKALTNKEKKAAKKKADESKKRAAKKAAEKKGKLEKKKKRMKADVNAAKRNAEDSKNKALRLKKMIDRMQKDVAEEDARARRKETEYQQKLDLLRKASKS